MRRFTLVLLAVVGTMSWARAADLIEAAPAECNCGSNMITIYDFEPGVVTRHWSANCECRYAPHAREFRKVAEPVNLRDYEPLVEPWRRW